MDNAEQTQTLPPLQQPSDTAPQRLVFTGSGSEYFRIWIVNLLLSIVTLGIYSAWAKVRKLNYFYDNTRLAGAGFEYHGNPVAILKGRIIAVLFIVAYKLAFRTSVPLGSVMAVALMLLFPWLIWKSLQFKLYNSSYRGIRFGFRGSAGRVYFVYCLLPLLTLLSIYLLAPFTHQRIKKFQHEESRYGATHFSFQGSVGSFYKAYLIAFLATIAGVIVIGLAFGGSMAPIFKSGGPKHAAPGALFAFMSVIVALYAWIFAILPLFFTLIQNLIWNNTGLGPHRFRSEMKVGKMTCIAVTNVIGIILTLGFFTPFAQVRAMKYWLESMSLIPGGGLDNFVAQEQAQVSATGEGVSDLLDFDLSL